MRLRLSRVSHAHYVFLARLVDAVLPPLAAFDFVSCDMISDVVVVAVVCFDLPSLSLFESYNDREEDGGDVDVDVRVVMSAGESE